MATTMQNTGAPGADHQQRQTMRPRSKTTFSITSDKSHNSRSSNKDKNRESHDEKRKLAFSNTTKANPNAAMNELQPIAQQLEKATIGSLRASTYFDLNGAPITDPDYSNPTRRRTERPLETIMSFEAAIDREYKRQRDAAREAQRNAYAQNESGTPDQNSNDSRRSSYWGGGDYAGNGYYNHPGRGRNSHFENPPSRNRYGARMNSDSAVQRYNHNVYSTPGYGQTRDTVNTGGSNGSNSDQWHNNTDPSSENSSIERPKQDGQQGEYGYPTQQRQSIPEDGRYTYSNGGGYNPSYMSGANGGPVGGSNMPGNYGGQQARNSPPMPPAKGGAVQPPAAARPVIRLDNSGPTATPGGRPALGSQPKRKSWLKRTFSKKD